MCLPGSSECQGEISLPPGNLGAEGQRFAKFGHVAFGLPVAFGHLKWHLNKLPRRRIASIQREQEGACIGH